MAVSSSSNAHRQMNIQNTWLNRWIYYLTASLMYAAVLLRSIIGYQGSPQFGLVMVLLLAWAIIFLGDVLLVSHRLWVSTVLVALEILIILSLLLITHSIRSDLFAFLFGITAMQVMQRHSPQVTAAVLALSALLTFLSLFQLFGILQAMALTLVYTALGIFLATYIWTTRQTRSIQKRYQVLSAELQEANTRLESYTDKAQKLTTSRERQRLARELHDSVTQTIFSMTLATQTARMSMNRDRRQVAAQLDRLDYLAQSALSEMQALVSHLNPEDMPGDFLEELRQHLAEREHVDNLKVTLEVDGDNSLTLAEEANLYRIAQEALNNIVKHACATTAILRLHLKEPFCMEIEDHGIGFDPNGINSSSKIGLVGMRERATEIGWNFEVESSSGRGTLIQVRKGTRQK
jgi:signal transduction histidine kinase